MQKTQVASSRYDPEAERLRFAQFRVDLDRRMDEAEARGEEDVRRAVKLIGKATLLFLLIVGVIYLVSHVALPAVGKTFGGPGFF